MKRIVHRGLRPLRRHYTVNLNWSSSHADAPDDDAGAWLLSLLRALLEREACVYSGDPVQGGAAGSRCCVGATSRVLTATSELV